MNSHLNQFLRYASREVKPIGWMVEMLGPADRGGLEEDYFSSSTSSYSSSGSSSSSSSSRSNSGWDGGSRKSSHTHGVKGSQCMHEDGGRYAIFESTERNPVSAQPGVCLEYLVTNSISIKLNYVVRL